MKEILEKQYNLLFRFFGVASRSWDMLHLECDRYRFCPENQESLIAEYLIWKEFVVDAHKYNVPYYHGIDDFLEAYKTAVENCLLLD